MDFGVAWYVSGAFNVRAAGEQMQAAGEQVRAEFPSTI